ncbi:MAG: mannose-1-phosphate guanylyltransferase/mannose-6-phosphate isomerase [Burkholderiales bacterium]|nr:MAG: mannose-1-phosphate guanylyltransferase/mannose-6-phosphate isomerase [Betaproteobacteria bacterium]TAG80720.1 MAG: mannose-1-phosphate guanylyltransferase/mannose-6-phosphate isomerase [Burkholderiales bacterium]
MKLLPVILCGGAGTRLWPLSRELSPKPFVHLPDGETLFAKTLARCAAVANALAPVVVTHKDHAHLARHAAKEAGFSAPQMLIEPIARNTAAAVAIAAVHAKETHGDDVALFILTSDHLIAPITQFAEAAETARLTAMTGKLVTFGITPTRPETGYGYVEAGEALPTGARRVNRFVEKPKLEVAKEYVSSGRFFWNSGMFVLPVGQLIAEMQRHCPEVLSASLHAYQPASVGASDIFIDQSPYANSPSISFDYAVMEKSAEVALVPASFAWSDIGSWNAFAEMLPADDTESRVYTAPLDPGRSRAGVAPRVIAHDSARTYVHTSGRLIATLGVSDLTIVDTEDALLIAANDRAQDVKHIVDALKKEGSELARLPLVVRRPWGTYEILNDEPGVKVKRIVVHPGASISLQLHRHRAEHWTVVAGVGEIEIDDKKIAATRNTTAFIPLGAKHRIRNTGNEDIVFIEVQTGDKLVEEDIQRFEDQYGRA